MGSLYLIRHGQASFGSGDYDKLSELGIEQARVLGAALVARHVQVDVVVCGAMRRHRQTASECLGAMGLATQSAEDSDWNEYDHQAMLEAFDPRYRHKSALAADLLRDGDLKRSFQSLFAQAASRWASGRFDQDYDESFGEFCTRLERALARVCERTGSGQTALVFSSGGAISALVGRLLGLTPERVMQLSYTLANASITKLLVGRRGVTLSTFNEHSHFEALERRLVSYR